MPHPHFTRPKQPHGRLILQARDIAILDLAYHYRFIDSYTLSRLLNHIGSAWALQARLQKLYDHHYLDRPPAQIALKVRDEERYLVYALGREGATVLAERYGQSLEKQRWTQKNQEAGDIHLRHTLGVTRVRATLRLAIPHNAPQEGCPDYTRPYLLPWRQGEELKARVLLPPRMPSAREEPFTLTPDGFFGIQTPEPPPNRSFFFLEYERSTNLKRFLQAKGEAYWAYWKADTHEKHLRIKGFRVLVIARTERKKETLRERLHAWLTKVTEHPADQIGMWLFTSEKRYRLDHPSSILTRIWQTAGDNRLLSLLD